MRQAMRIPFLVAVLAILAGCTSPPNEPDATAASPPVLEDAAVKLLFDDCRQYHTYYTARADDFAAFVPAGFTQPSDEAGLTSLRVEATACPGTGMLWITIPIVPPTELSNTSYVHTLAIEAYVDNATALQQLQTWGIPFVKSCRCQASTAPNDLPLADGFTVDGEQDDYQMQTTLLPSSGPFGEEHTLVYIAHDGQAIGRLQMHGSGANNRGFGGVVLAYIGPGSAPPITPGNLAHVVQDLSLAIGYEELPASRPADSSSLARVHERPLVGR